MPASSRMDFLPLAKAKPIGNTSVITYLGTKECCAVKNSIQGRADCRVEWESGLSGYLASSQGQPTTEAGSSAPSEVCQCTELCGAVDKLEGSDAIQGDPDRLERWDCMNLMKFNKAKCKVLHLGQGNPQHKNRLSVTPVTSHSQVLIFFPGLAMDIEMGSSSTDNWETEMQMTLMPGYISQVLRNYTDHACDGEYVSLRCPHRTTISIQSSFYGRIVPSHQMCPSRYPHSYATLIKEDVACSVGTSLQKMLDECQDRRSCQFLVNSRLFGTDPCPGTGKYLIVWYKCRPNEYKSKVACEDDKLRLSCKKSMVIAIYSAIFGRTQGGGLECPYQNLGMPMIGLEKYDSFQENGSGRTMRRVLEFTIWVNECQSATALQLMIKRCHGKRSCSIYASTYEFGDPCYPGIQKHLNVIYTCGNGEKRLLLRHKSSHPKRRTKRKPFSQQDSHNLDSWHRSVGDHGSSECKGKMPSLLLTSAKLAKKLCPYPSTLTLEWLSQAFGLSS
ncbi:hypothetical protein BTVI_112396 [Pitangus sulphuratus]|nr:hypothetical protein BTVI_112396 [Pitangus sulphuratus]